MQFNAVVETTSTQSAMGVARLHDSEGVHLNQVGGVRHHDVGSPIHTSPAVAVKAGL